ncbi:MAG: hypothetical protein ACTSRS_07250 [Candidatus Helarchaeota archaeon]
MNEGNNLVRYTNVNATSTADLEIQFVDPNNYTVSWNLTEEAPWDYLGKYSFTEDTVGMTPNGWTVDEPGASRARVLSEKVEHAKVVELTRTSTDRASMTNIFGAKSASAGHEIEFWMWGENNSQGILDVQNGGAGFQSKIWLWMNF